MSGGDGEEKSGNESHEGGVDGECLRGHDSKKLREKENEESSVEGAVRFCVYFRDVWEKRGWWYL